MVLPNTLRRDLQFVLSPKNIRPLAFAILFLEMLGLAEGRNKGGPGDVRAKAPSAGGAEDMVSSQIRYMRVILILMGIKVIV